MELFVEIEGQEVVPSIMGGTDLVVSIIYTTREGSYFTELLFWILSAEDGTGTETPDVTPDFPARFHPMEGERVS